jgi:hypothetical protein
MDRWAVIISVGQTVATVVLGIIGYGVREMIKDFKAQLVDHGQRISEIEKGRVRREEFDRLANEVESTVSKEDWLRAHNDTRQLLVKMSNKVEQLNGVQDACVNIASAIAAALNKQREG